MEASAEILNKALDLALEWGENFGKPIQERLSKIYPLLSPEELEQCQKTCQEAKYFAFGLLYDLYEKGHKEPSAEQYHHRVLEKYPWVSSDNLSRLLTQGRYYAWRDFG